MPAPGRHRPGRQNSASHNPQRQRAMSVERRGRRKGAASLSGDQLPWSQPRMTMEPSRILSDDHLEAIHQKSLRVLEEIGMDILHPEARDILARAGAIVCD